MEGIRNLHFKMFDGAVWTLNDVRYVPRLTKNLIYVGILDDASYTNKIESGVMKNGLYYLIENTVTGDASIAANNEDSNVILWHGRLGYTSEKRLKVIHDQGLLEKDKISTVDLCESCILGKQHMLVSVLVNTIPREFLTIYM